MRYLAARAPAGRPRRGTPLAAPPIRQRTGVDVSGVVFDIVLVFVFILISGYFVIAEMSLVSLRDAQAKGLEGRGRRGHAVAKLNADPNRFLASVQVGVTLAGFFSAAFGGAVLAQRLAPVVEGWGVSSDVADVVALILVTLVISYVSLVHRRADAQAARPAARRVDRPRRRAHGRPDRPARAAGHLAAVDVDQPGRAAARRRPRRRIASRSPTRRSARWCRRSETLERRGAADRRGRLRGAATGRSAR